MHRDYTSKRQEVCAGLTDNTLSSFSHLRQHFKPKGWIIKCVSSCHVKTKTHMNWRERIYSIVSLSFTGNRRNKKINSSGKVLSVLRRTAKPTSTTARMGFYLLGRIPSTFLGPRMLTPPSPSQNDPLVSGQSRSTDLCVRLSAPLCTPSSTCVCFLRWAWGLDWATWPLQHIEEDTPSTELILVLHPGKPSGLLRRESCSKFAQQFSQLIWDFPIFSQRPYTVLLFQNCLELGQWNYFSTFLATDAKVYTKLPSDVLFTIRYFLLIP